ncbi:MAG: ThuA domain-containing protein [Phycisphaerae bacterium]|nr:ThuA domain-containing protein [Phycisphaerae bacterium]
MIGSRPLMITAFVLMMIAAVGLRLGQGPAAASSQGAAPAPKSAPPQPKGDSAPAPLPRVLVFTKTAAFRHDSIPDGIRAVREIGAGAFEIDATEDAAAFTDDNLTRYRAVVWLSTSGEVLNDEQQAAFERYIRAGGGYAGIHAASDTEYEWPWYGKLVGAYFQTHPPVQSATQTVEVRDHASTRMLPERWMRTDEWYSFRSNPRGTEGIRVLMSLDESTYEPAPATMGADHPIAWYHEFDGGRSWYTGGGHTKESFSEPLFREHLLGGILWAAGLDSSAAPSSKPKATRGATPSATPSAPSDGSLER